MLYVFELEVSKNICCTKSQGAIDHSEVNRWLKKFCSGYKKLD